MINIEFLKPDNIPDKHRNIIVDEISRVVSMPMHNKGMDVRITWISTLYTNSSNIWCSSDSADIICMKIKFDRIDRKRDLYKLRSSGHLGLQIFLPKKIRQNRNRIIDDVLCGNNKNITK